MTQAQLACALYPNLSAEDAEKRKGDISKLETGKVPNPTTQTIKRLADALDITDDELDALHQRVQMSASDQLDNVSVLDRDQLELLAGRFEIDRAFAKSDEELAGILQNKAQEYRDLRGQIANLPEHVPQVMEIKQQAEKAAEALDFERVEKLLTIADIKDTKAAAQTKITRASNALLRNRPEQAFEILSAVADSFRSANPTAPTQIRGQLFELLYNHGVRYGGQGLQFAEKMLEEAEDALPANAPAAVSATVLLNLAVARGTMAPRLAGPDATEKLGKVAETLRILLERLSPADPQWGKVQHNLGNALKEQGTLTDGAAGITFLAEAVTAYRAALTVRTETDHPTDWAMTQNSLAITLKYQGIRTDGAAGTTLLGEAVTAYRAALNVYTDADYPVRWAEIQANLAIAEIAIADHETTTDPRPHLDVALAHADAALTVFDPEHMSYHHAKTTRLRDGILSLLENLS